MKTWQTAGREFRCAFDWSHVIHASDRYLELTVPRVNRAIRLCATCAYNRHDAPFDARPDLAAIAESVEPAPTPDTWTPVGAIAAEIPFTVDTYDGPEPDVNNELAPQYRPAPEEPTR